VLPLDAICTRAELDARQILNEQVLTAEYVQVRGWLGGWGHMRQVTQVAPQKQPVAAVRMQGLSSTALCGKLPVIIIITRRVQQAASQLLGIPRRAFTPCIGSSNAGAP
jgi:hypothetical protein